MNNYKPQILQYNIPDTGYTLLIAYCTIVCVCYVFDCTGGPWVSRMLYPSTYLFECCKHDRIKNKLCHSLVGFIRYQTCCKKMMPEANITVTAWK